MKEQDRTFFENVVFTCMFILSGIISLVGVVHLFKMAFWFL